MARLELRGNEQPARELSSDPKKGQAWAGMKAWTASTRVPSTSMLMIVALKGPVPLSATRTSSPTTGGRFSSQQPGGTVARPLRTGVKVRSATTWGTSSTPIIIPVVPGRLSFAEGQTLARWR